MADQNNADTDPASAPKKQKRAKLERVSFLVDRHGRPAVDRLHDESRSRLLTILRDRSLAQELGIEGAPAPVDAGDLLPPTMIQGLIVGLGHLEAVILARVTKAPRALVDRIVPYTAEEVAALQPPMTAVLSKYGGPALSKYGDEAALAVLLVTLTTKKLQAIADAMGKGTGPRVVPITSADNDEPAPEVDRLQ
jgi:hypothetical protein